MSNITVALDAGHGGTDSGAVYGNRKEKDDVLLLTKAIGNILEKNGINVFYTRTTDEYETPFKKATDANNSDADYFVSIHRNASEKDNQYSGIQTLVYSDTGIRSQFANNINEQLVKLGFDDLGVVERPNLVVLKRTNMPAVLVEVGFINTDSDNKIFDEDFNEIAEAIADGILETIYSQTSKTDAYDEEERKDAETSNVTTILPNNIRQVPYSMDEEPTCNCNNGKLYRVQVGAFKNKENADRMLDSLLIEGFPAFMIYDNGYYKVQVGAYMYLTNAIKMEQKLRRYRYNTYIVYD